MKTKQMAYIAMIAAVYTAVSLALAPISFGMMQVRIAEALTMLPLIYEPGIWGVTLGCFLTNLLGVMMGINPTGAIDAVVGTLATLGAAYCTWKLREKTIRGVPVAAMAMPVIWNFVFVGTELGILFPVSNHLFASILINGAWVAVGEVVSVILGFILVRMLAKTKLFTSND
ncbi:MAG TPA: QueT transporter family protein [Erysipelotrichaceae bacterium]|jgi:uncharacterized membrane protein|nr:QueT transporter family protein [Erysipelotrichaceae bacterium]HCV55102.1 QueT transporter family protein [Erysipelotrichaceae bacterium]